MDIIKLEQVSSTNRYAADLLQKGVLTTETIVYTDYQLVGRGTDNNKWLSEKGQNMLFSLVCFPNADAERHFMLSMSVSLSLVKYLIHKQIPAQIKWPNDIYVANKKIAGTLIENMLIDNKIHTSIVGVGLNVNQRLFAPELPNPVSMTQVTNARYHDLKTEMLSLCNVILDNIHNDLNADFNTLKQQYLSKLYKLNAFHSYIIDNQVVTAKIVDVLQSGHIVVETDAGHRRNFFFKEIEYIL